jgi:DNA replication protein DnaC
MRGPVAWRSSTSSRRSALPVCARACWRSTSILTRVVDELGDLSHDDVANAHFHVVHERHIRRRGIIFTTDKGPADWGAVPRNDDFAAAIVDRILERGRLLRLDGPSGRT